MKQKEIVLVTFPFSDQTGQKVRPAVIVSNDKFNTKSEDLLVCAITSNLKPSDYSIEIDQKDIELGSLHDKCVIKVESIIKMRKTLVIKKIASIKETTFLKIKEILLKL